MREKLFILLTLLPALSLAYNDNMQVIDDTADTNLIGNATQSQSSPVIPVSILDSHHYSLNHKPFDNKAISHAQNSHGLSLHSVHPVIYEDTDSMVTYYYQNGETLPGATTSVWQFFMNADGMPSDYVPTVEEDRLSGIASDTMSAMSNLSFVNSPDQCWFQVSLYNEDTNDFDTIAPDYLLQDHPDSVESKFSHLAITNAAIQTQSNKRWCFKHNEPAVNEDEIGEEEEQSDFLADHAAGNENSTIPERCEWLSNVTNNWVPEY